MRLVMLGPPAAGKGTQGQLLCDRYGIPHISTGSMFRASIQSGSAVGKQAHQYLERGELVPDAIAVEVVKERLQQADCQAGFVLDGFPRTVQQAESLDMALKAMRTELDAVINIHITAAESINRIAHRRICAQCGVTARANESDTCRDCGGSLVQRPDDTPDTARNRLTVYLKQTEPVIDYYRSHGRLIMVDGMQSEEQVFASMVAQLMQLRSGTDMEHPRGEAAK